MDFEKIIKVLIEKFKHTEVRYGLIGGFAMGILGIPKTTVDLDILIYKEDFEKVDKIMKELGYNCQYISENVAQYISSLKPFGEIDYIFAFRETSRNMIQRAIEKCIFNGKYKIKVLQPEDIIGLKLQAMANDEERENKELLDIESLMTQYKENLDWKLIEEYFLLFDQQDLFNKLKGKYDKAN